MKAVSLASLCIIPTVWESLCYNGNISSMTWKSGAGATPRGYKFSYDRLGRLTDAEVW